MSDTPKHTPGPWRWFEHSTMPGQRLLFGSDGQGFAHTVGLDSPTDEANANIMAAAPTLLAMVEEMLDELEGALEGDIDHIDKRSVRKRAKALIAKARGGTP